MVILNGVGYDNWAERLLQASPAGGRVVLNVGDVLGLAPGANPHQWYSPSHVERVIEEIARDYERVDPADARYFAQRMHAFLATGFARYDALRRQIRARFAGTPVGYSESIFQPLGQDLGLKLMTPYGFAKAISGSDGVHRPEPAQAFRVSVSGFDKFKIYVATKRDAADKTYASEEHQVWRKIFLSVSYMKAGLFFGKSFELSDLAPVITEYEKYAIDIEKMDELLPQVPVQTPQEIGEHHFLFLLRDECRDDVLRRKITEVHVHLALANARVLRINPSVGVKPHTATQPGDIDQAGPSLCVRQGVFTFGVEDQQAHIGR